MICDDDSYLMFIEPVNPGIAEPVIDTITRTAAAVLGTARGNGNVYKGIHVCCCGATSGSEDLIVKSLARRLTTHSLLVHYVACHRDEVPRTELAKLAEVYRAAGPLLSLCEPTPEQLMTPRYLSARRVAAKAEWEARQQSQQPE